MLNERSKEKERKILDQQKKEEEKTLNQQRTADIQTALNEFRRSSVSRVVTATNLIRKVPILMSRINQKKPTASRLGRPWMPS